MDAVKLNLVVHCQDNAVQFRWQDCPAVVMVALTTLTRSLDKRAKAGESYSREHIALAEGKSSPIGVPEGQAIIYVLPSINDNLTLVRRLN
mmetsp:Transcript_53338/g.98632  ORF Transcript_53338/g.98632 Transcript_53338/m.98632 type:complete len:91 (+) Transcript_53338:646-918(+)